MGTNISPFTVSILKETNARGQQRRRDDVQWGTDYYILVCIDKLGYVHTPYCPINCKRVDCHKFDGWNFVCTWSPVSCFYGHSLHAFSFRRFVLSITLRRTTETSALRFACS